jgi:hypothetical protein
MKIQPWCCPKLDIPEAKTKYHDGIFQAISSLVILMKRMPFMVD